MAQNIGTLEFEIRANLAPYQAGLKQAQGEAKRFEGAVTVSLNRVSQATVELTKTTQNYVKQEKGAADSTGRFGQVLGFAKSRVEGLLGPLSGLVGLAGIGGVAFSAQQAVEAYGQWELAHLALEARVRSLRGSLGPLGDDLEDFTRQIARATLTSSDQLRNIAVEMGRTGQITSDNIRRAIAILPDLALRLGSLQKASSSLTEALKDPATAITALREAGVTLTQSQKQLLENTLLFEDRMRNATQVLAILEDQIGGEAAARGSGTAGAFSRLADSSFTLFVNIGRVIDGLLGMSATANTAAEAMERLNKRIAPANAAERVENLKTSIKALEQVIADLQTQAARGTPVFLGGVSQGQIEARIRQLARLKNVLAGTEIQQADQAAKRIVDEFLVSRDKQNERIQETISNLEDEAKALAGTTAQARARAITQRLGIELTSEEGQKILELTRHLEGLRKARAASSQPSILEQENLRITRQLDLLRLGTRERQIQVDILRVELALKRRGQSFDEADRQNLEERLRLLQSIKSLTSTVESAFSSVFNSMASALTEFATTGEFEFKKFADSVISDLIRIATEAFIIQPLLNAVTGGVNPLLASAATASATPSVGFQHGGSFEVPGSGSQDKPALLVGLTPGERVDVTPASQTRQGGGQSVTVINNINSSKQFEVEQTESTGPNGEKIINQTFSEVMKRVGRGDADATFGARFGMRPRTAQR